MDMRHKGFTIIETIVVMGIISTLVGIGYISVVGMERRVPVSATVDTLMADIRGQQTKAMTGDTQTGTLAGNYGIHFETDSYTLFKGSQYNAGDASNMVTPLPENISFRAITVPNASVIFTRGSGDVAGYISGNDTVAVQQDLTGEQKTITINRYGAVVSIQ